MTTRRSQHDDHTRHFYMGVRPGRILAVIADCFVMSSLDSLHIGFRVYQSLQFDIPNDPFQNKMKSNSSSHVERPNDVLVLHLNDVIKHNL